MCMNPLYNKKAPRARSAVTVWEVVLLKVREHYLLEGFPQLQESFRVVGQ